MGIDVFWLIASIGGGAFAAAIGGQTAFIFTGFAFFFGLSGLLGESTGGFMEFVTFGPVFGPQITFSGGVAAAAYAGRRGYLANGKDIITPLATLAKPDVLAVGGVFGALGYLIERAVALIPWFGSSTDVVAFAVVVSAVIVRLVLSRSKVFGPCPKGEVLGTKDTHWVEWQEGWGILAAHGFYSGLIFAAAGPGHAPHDDYRRPRGDPLLPDRGREPGLRHGRRRGLRLHRSLGG